jgi:uncharacterized protein
MTLDPREGITDDGYIATGADWAHISPRYRALIGECRKPLADRLGDSLVALFVYGSVATGQAQAPASDLDLLAVLQDETPAAAEMAADLSARHKGFVREVGIATTTLSAAFEDSAAALGWRAFIHHYCVHVSGRDLGSELGPFKANAEMAWAFNSDVGEAVAAQIAALHAHPSQAAGVGRTSARKLLLAGASLVSALDGIWTTDRGIAARRLRADYPNQAGMVDRLAAWSEECDAGADEVASVIKSCLDWIAPELARAARIRPRSIDS